MRSSLLQAAPVHNAIKRCKTIGKTARTADRLYKRKYKMKRINWLVVGIIGIIALLFLFGGGMMSAWGYRGMMGGPGMMGWGYSPFGWIGMIFMWLIPVGFIALVVLGIIWLVRNVGNSTLPSSISCPNCGKAYKLIGRIVFTVARR
jgi:hypothetical protein